MTLWNIIRDFFVQYIFGGYTSSGNTYSSLFADIGYLADGDYEVYELSTSEQLYKICELDGAQYFISVGDWLSTTATIITLCAICVFLFFFVRWLFRLTAGLVSGRG